MEHYDYEYAQKVGKRCAELARENRLNSLQNEPEQETFAQRVVQKIKRQESQAYQEAQSFLETYEKQIIARLNAQQCEGVSE